MRDKPPYDGPYDCISIDTDLHYELDLSKFPGINDPQKLREPALMIASEPFCFRLHAATENFDDDADDDGDDDVDDHYDDGDDNVCVFCDALNDSEDDGSHLQQSLPCYLQNRLYIFHDAHDIDCQTVEVHDEVAVGLSPTDDRTGVDAGQDIHLKSGIQQCQNMDHDSSADPPTCNHTVISRLTFTELSACVCDSDYGMNLVDRNCDLASPTSEHMDASITEHLPLFIDLVDNISPIISPGGSVRPRKWNTSNSACDSNTVAVLTHRLAANDEAIPIYASLERFLHAGSSSVFTRWS